MSEHDDPRRLTEGDAAFAEVTAGLRSARERGPSAEQAARMRAALSLTALPAPSAANAAPVSVARVTPARHGWLKLIAGGALVIAAAIGVWRGGVRGPHLEPPVTPPRQTLAAPVIPVPAPAAVPAPLAPDPQTRAAADVEHSAASARPQRGARANHATAPVQAPPDIAAELALLKRAKADARSAPAHALALVSEHEQRFARGALVEEREVIAIEALLASGRRSASEARAAQFFARFPDSAHGRRVHALIDDAAASQSDTKSTPSQHPSH